MKTMMVVACVSAFIVIESLAIDDGVHKTFVERLASDSLASIQATSTNLVITLPSHGRRYLCRRNDGPIAKSEYGKTLNVPLGDSLTLIDRHQVITIRPLSDSLKPYGFAITEQIDQRSFGKEIVTNAAFVATFLVPAAQKTDISVVPNIDSSEKSVETFVSASSGSKSHEAQ